MDTGLAIRPTPSAAQAALVRAEPAPARQAVTTDLAPAQSVTATADTTAPRNDAARLVQDTQVRKIILDAHSREVIFQVLDESSGRVVRQVPDEALLRLRAYTRAAADGLSPHEAQADLEA